MTFTVMSWNVENFFTAKPADQAAYDAKVSELKSMLNSPRWIALSALQAELADPS